jgi:endonuclease/exonuclease/phosphatase family metal-dependent hydrolase
MPAVRVLTWNVQGSHGVDTVAVADVIRRATADVVVLQEIQNRQTARLAAALGMAGRAWAFKHWTIARRAEGAAVLTTGRLVATTSFVLRRAPYWSWRRRVAIEATLELGAERRTVVGAHLSPHGAADWRRGEAELVLARASAHAARPIICGDLNDPPDGPAYNTFVLAGWADAWRAVHGDASEPAGATNWTAGRRRGRPPTQRLDYVMAPPGWFVESCTVAVEPDRLDDAAALSDHLPVVARLRPPPSHEGEAR